MKEKFKRRLYSQNILRKRKLAEKLVRNSSIDKNDIVFDIGAGKGRLTEFLLKKASEVIAVEIDKDFCEILEDKFKSAKNLSIINDNFLNLSLPDIKYKVFSNIPFNISTKVISTILDDDNFIEGYFVVQKEFAESLIGNPYFHKNTQKSMFYYPLFEFWVEHKFSKTDFEPAPSVDSVLLKIRRREVILIKKAQLYRYRKFITKNFNSKRNYSYKKKSDIINEFNQSN